MKSLFILVLSMVSSQAAAFCGTYVGSPGVELTNQTSQVIIARQGARTTLTLANDYIGDAKDFAMLIPVPEVLDEDDISTVRPELFQRFDDYSAPRLVRYECEDYDWQDDALDGDADSSPDVDVDADEGGAPRVVVEAEYSVGIYEIVILSADESGALIDWLTINGYGVNGSAEALLGEYIEAGAFFFAAKVALQKVGDGEFLEPLQFGYASEVFSLPIRLGTLNSPGEQDVVMYILTNQADGKVGIANYPRMEIEDECMAEVWNGAGLEQYYGDRFQQAFDATEGAGWMVEYGWATSWCDPCATQPPTGEELEEAGFYGDEWDTYFTRIRMRYTAEAARQDLTLYASGLNDTEQIRYISYAEEMEDRHPVCGLGMVDDPGSCDPTEHGDSEDDGTAGSTWTPSPHSAPVDSEGPGGGGCSTARGEPVGALALGWLALAAALRRRSVA